MKLFIASDHAGIELKEKIKLFGRGLNCSWDDLGPANPDSVDYPNFAQKLSKKILEVKNEDELLQPCGVLICGSGVGMSISANRFKKIRAALCMNSQVAVLSRQHNASNVLCLGSRLLTDDENLKIFTSWLEAPFEGGRHLRRVELIDEHGETL